MLALQNSKQELRACTVNVLPCRIHHSGPSKVTKRSWAPTTEKDGSKVSYFRGRKLKGTAVHLPTGYTGVVAKSTERVLAQPYQKTGSKSASALDDDSDDDIQCLDDEPEPVKVLESTSEFKEVVVWGHDQTPGHDDDFVKGVEEWIVFASAIHGTHRP